MTCSTRCARGVSDRGDICRSRAPGVNHLLGIEAGEVPSSERDRCRARLAGAIDRLSADDLGRVMVKVEALGRHMALRLREGH
jgi:hypothetical protein